jgi:hypothetical protein
MANVPPFTSQYAFPQEGLNAILNIIPKQFDNAAHTLGNLYIGLFTTSWATIQAYTSAAIQLNTGTYPVTELASTGYARSAALTAGTWGANTASTVTIGANSVATYQSTYTGGVTFTNSSSSTWTAVNGMFIATGSAGGTAGTASGSTCTVLWYSPFSDSSTVTLAPNDSLTVTPSWITVPYPA